MDYEKAYKDLMRDIDIAIEGQNNGETKVVLQNIKERNIESEDERIRKRLVEYFNGYYDRFSSRNNVNVHWEGLEVKAVIAWLEKQKENPKTADSIPSNCVSDAKWASSVLTNAIVSLSDAVDYNCSEPFRYKQEIDELKKLREEIERQKEQKPAEKISVSEELYEHIRNACACIEDAMSSDTMCDMTDYLEMANSSAQKAFDMVDKSVVKQPAEWSEEDEDIRDTIIRDLKRLGGDIANVKPAYKKEIDWLKSLRPQHHWKPSEEQIDTLEAVVGMIHPTDTRYDAVFGLLDELKAL